MSDPEILAKSESGPKMGPIRYFHVGAFRTSDGTPGYFSEAGPFEDINEAVSVAKRMAATLQSWQESRIVEYEARGHGTASPTIAWIVWHRFNNKGEELPLETCA